MKTYYFLQAGIERSKRFGTPEEAEAEAGLFNQIARMPRLTIREAVEGKRGSTVVKELSAACVKNC